MAKKRAHHRKTTTHRKKVTGKKPKRPKAGASASVWEHYYKAVIKHDENIRKKKSIMRKLSARAERKRNK